MAPPPPPPPPTTGSTRFLKKFHQFALSNEKKGYSSHHNAYTAFLRLLTKEDPFIVEKCFLCLTRLLVLMLRDRISGGAEQYKLLHLEHLSNFIDVIVTQIQQQHRIQVAVHALMELLKYDESRILLYRARGIPHLIALLRKNMAHVQSLYEVGVCLWMLSFGVKNYEIRQTQLKALESQQVVDQQADGPTESTKESSISLTRHSSVITPMDMFANENLIPRLHDVLRNTQKEKVIRVVLGTFKNLANTHRQFIMDIVRVSVPKTLSNLLKRNFEDKDIHEDLKELVDLLDQYIEDISSFDEYRQEVLSGRLQWTPVHESEKFWKENLNKLEQDNFFIIRELIKLLGEPEVEISSTVDTRTRPSVPQEKGKSSTALQSATMVNLPTVASEDEHIQNLIIACHDLGQFVRYFPRGKRVLINLDAKTKILALMEHPNAEVRKHALLCTQKLMIQNWSMLQ